MTMSRDLHMWGLHEMTKKLCLQDKFLVWADTKNIKDIEKQELSIMIMRPHVKSDWKPEIYTHHLIKLTNGRNTDSSNA